MTGRPTTARPQHTSSDEGRDHDDEPRTRARPPGALQPGRKAAAKKAPGREGPRRQEGPCAKRAPKAAPAKKAARRARPRPDAGRGRGGRPATAPRGSQSPRRRKAAAPRASEARRRGRADRAPACRPLRSPHRPAGSRAGPRLTATAPRPRRPRAGGLPPAHGRGLRRRPARRRRGWSSTPSGSWARTRPGRAGWSARLRPDAISVAVLDQDGSRYEAPQLHGGGIYEARLPQQPGDYRVEVGLRRRRRRHQQLHRRRPVPLAADRPRARPVPHRRGPARAAVGGARLARAALRHPQGVVEGVLVRRLGARTPAA